MTQRNGKDLTTSQAAQACGMSASSIRRNIASGALPAYPLPASGLRRIQREDLETFMREHGIPLDGLGDHGLTKVIVVSERATLCQACIAAMPPQEAFAVKTTDSAFEAGMLAQRFGADALVVDFGADTLIRRIPQDCRRSGRFPAIVIIGIVRQGQRLSSTEQSSVNKVFGEPINATIIARRIGTLVRVKKEPA